MAWKKKRKKRPFPSKRKVSNTSEVVMCYPRKQITIKGTSYPWQVVKSQFLKLKPVHIANLLERLVDNSLEIHIRIYNEGGAVCVSK